MKVTVCNWEKFNYRKDTKKPSWFRFDHDFFENHNFFDFSDHEIRVWLYVLCQASKRSGWFIWNDKHSERIGCVNPKMKNQTLLKLQSLELLHMDVTDTHEDVTSKHEVVTSPCSTNGRTNERTGHLASEFDAIWNSWPIKVGRRQARERFLHQVQSEDRLEEFRSAVQNYLEMKSQEREPRYKQLRYFIGANSKPEWVNYIPDEPTAIKRDWSEGMI